MKQKLPYKNAEVEMILFNLADIITASNNESPGSPDIGNDPGIGSSSTLDNDILGNTDSSGWTNIGK